MKTQKKIAITGGIGSGKSTVARLIQEKGYPVFSCDEIYREICHDQAYIHEIAKEFPNAIYENRIDRHLLSKIVFNNDEKREKLNSIAHPIIMNTLKKRMEQSVSPLVFAEVPLLFEGNYDAQFDAIIVVLREKLLRIKSIAERDGLTTEQIISRIQSQFDYNSKEGRLRLEKPNVYLIKNNVSVVDLENSIHEILQKL